VGQGSGHSRTENVPQRSCVQRKNFHLTGKVELGMNETSQCEVYSETTNEWQFIASFSIRPEASPKLSSVDDQLYALGSCMWNEGDSIPDTRVECYDADKNEWIRKTGIEMFRSFQFVPASEEL